MIARDELLKKMKKRRQRPSVELAIDHADKLIHELNELETAAVVFAKHANVVGWDRMSALRKLVAASLRLSQRIKNISHAKLSLT